MTRRPANARGPARRAVAGIAALATVAALACGAAAPARAGQACTEEAPTTVSVQRGLELAEHVRAALDDSGARVVLLARAGQDLDRWGLRWSHFGFAYLDEAATPPTWRVVHKLNQCGTDHADVFRQGLGDFFLDAPFRYEAAIVTLSPETEQALLPVITDDRRVVQWHTKRYSVVAYPWATRYQQSNQWALETLAGAIEPAASDRERAQMWLRLHDYRPADLHIDAFTRLGARITRANVAFDDHPNERRFSDHIDTVTAESVFDWLLREHRASSPMVVR